MLSVAEALAVVLRHTPPLPPQAAPLDVRALGRVLAEDVASDLDMPPFDKAMMDGYAVRAADLPEGRGTLQIIEEVTAGRTPQKSLGPGQATRIMTGAPVPSGCDAVVIVERTILDGERVVIEDRPPRPGQHILRRGLEMRAGEIVLDGGSLIRAQELGLLASVGRTSALLHPAPTVAVLSTGDEVVEAGQAVGAGQIRNSNGPLLMALAAQTGAEPRYLGIARDDRDELRQRVRSGLESDVLLLSGGVSAGKLDLVPGVLDDEGVTAHFHKVEMKPGKPLLFGSRGRTLVFGLPGNPVSGFVGFALFVRPALRQLGGHAEPGPIWWQLPLADDFAYPTDRPTYHPARVVQGEGGLQVKPVAWFGSPDLRGLTRADALLLVPAGKELHRAGAIFSVLSLGDPGRREPC